MGITYILGRIWLFSANKIKSSESFSKQPNQLIVELNSSLRHIIVTQELQFNLEQSKLCEETFQNTILCLYHNLIKHYRMENNINFDKCHYV